MLEFLVLQCSSQNDNMVYFRIQHSLPFCLTLAINHGTNWIASRIVRLININIYLSGFDKRYLQKFLVTVSFEACSVLDHSFFFLNDLFSTKIPLKAAVDQKNMCLICCLHLPYHPSPPSAALPYLSFPIILPFS